MDNWRQEIKILEKSIPEDRNCYNVWYPLKIINSNLTNSSSIVFLPFLNFFWNFAQCIALIPPCSVQYFKPTNFHNFAICHQQIQFFLNVRFRLVFQGYPLLWQISIWSTFYWFYDTCMYWKLGHHYLKRWWCGLLLSHHFSQWNLIINRTQLRIFKETLYGIKSVNQRNIQAITFAELLENFSVGCSYL